RDTGGGPAPCRRPAPAATSAAMTPNRGDGSKAEVINYGFLADAVLSTDDVVKAISRDAGFLSRSGHVATAEHRGRTQALHAPRGGPGSRGGRPWMWPRKPTRGDAENEALNNRRTS